MDPAEGSRVGIPILRALLRFGLQQLAKNLDESWDVWFNSIFRYIDFKEVEHTNYWDQVISLERSLIREVLQVEVADGDDTLEMTLDEVRGLFGQWIPIRLYDQTGPSQALRYTLQNRLILYGHTIRKNGETIEVDIDGYTGERIEWS